MSLMWTPKTNKRLSITASASRRVSGLPSGDDEKGLNSETLSTGTGPPLWDPIQVHLIRHTLSFIPNITFTSGLAEILLETPLTTYNGSHFEHNLNRNSDRMQNLRETNNGFY